MKALTTRLQIQLIALGYASLLLYAVYEWYIRHLAELRYPIDAQGGMWAFGDEILAYYLFFLFLVPTFFLLRLLRTSERAYTAFAKFALGAALTAPLSLLLMAANVEKFSDVVGGVAVMRLLRSPMLIIALITSRIVARERPAKRLLNWAVAIEILTLAGGIVAALILARVHSQG